MFFLKVKAQTNVPKKNADYIAVLADGRNDSIIIRWAPSSTKVWQLGIKYGYKLERYTIQRDGKVTNELLNKTTLLIDSIKPYKKEDWDAIINTDDRAAIVYSGIYEVDSFKATKATSIEDMMKAQQDKDMKMSFSLFACDIDMRFAKAAGLLYVDKNIKKNERYIYKVSIAATAKNKEIQFGNTTSSYNQTQKLPKIKISRVQWGNRLASINWDTKYDKGIYSAYYVERSLDGQQFTPVTDLPIIAGAESPTLTKSAYEDSLVDNEKMYYYRLKGLTPFGETGPISEVVSGHGAEANDILPIITSGKGDNVKRTARITWVFPAEKKTELAGFQILRAEVAEGPYSEINPKVLEPTDTVFVDTNPKNSNYYKVKAVGKENEIAISFPYLITVYDADPPKAPIGIKGIVSDSGVVVLKWRQNKEADLLGYRVFKSNNLKEDFIELSREFITKNSFNDTVVLNTLTKEVFYKIVAVDQNFNNSVFSEPYLLKKPDIVPPAQPLLANYRLEKGKLKMEWQPSVSDDVVKYVLQRVEKTNYDVTEVVAWTPAKPITYTTIIDSTATLGKTYYYQLLAYDDAGNSSFGRTGELEYETGVRKPITDFRATANFQERRIILTWSYDKNYEVERYILYRCKKGEPMEIYETMLGNKTYWEEKNLPIGNYYQYQIKAELKGDLKTEISKIVEVKY